MQPGLQRKYSPLGFVPIGMDCMALTCLRQVSANGIPQDLHGQIRGIGAESPILCGAKKAPRKTNRPLTNFQHHFILKP
jgi:hypothetical protein